MSFLKVTNLSVDIPLETGVLAAVRGVDLSVDRQECLGIVGESGSGKSITALSIPGLLPPRARRTATSIQLGGEEIGQWNEQRLASEVRGRRVSYIFQEPMTSLNPVMSIGRQLTEVMTVRGLADEAGARRRAIALMERVGLRNPEQRLAQFPHQFSGGQRQRIMIAMALMNTPELLIADEPTTALDVTVQAQIIDLLDELRREMGLALVLISHNLGLVARIADRVAVMYAGEIVEQAPTRPLFDDPRHPYASGLLASAPEASEGSARTHLGAMKGRVPSLYGPAQACVFQPRCPRAQAVCAELHPDDTADEGRAFRCHFPLEQGNQPFAKAPAAAAASSVVRPPQPPVLLTASGLVKTYPGRAGLLGRQAPVEAVRGVDFSLARGETLAIVGESGCGKSTIARLLVGLETPTAGAITLADAAGDDRMARARRIQLVFQDPYSALNPSWSVHELVRRPMDLHRIGALAERNRRAETLLDQMSLPKRLRRSRVGELSGGQRQRVAIARALAITPDILVCDEPTSALDVSVQAQILNLLLDLQDELQLSMILISHDLSVVGHMADRVLVMHSGQVVEEGPARTVLERPKADYTRDLIAASPRIHPVASTPVGPTV